MNAPRLALLALILLASPARADGLAKSLAACGADAAGLTLVAAADSVPLAALFSIHFMKDSIGDVSDRRLAGRMALPDAYDSVTIALGAPLTLAGMGTIETLANLYLFAAKKDPAGADYSITRLLARRSYIPTEAFARQAFGNPQSLCRREFSSPSRVNTDRRDAKAAASATSDAPRLPAAQYQSRPLADS